MFKGSKYIQLESITKKYIGLLSGINYMSYGEDKYVNFTEDINNLINDLHKNNLVQIKSNNESSYVYNYISGNEEEFILIKIYQQTKNGKFPFSKINFTIKSKNSNKYIKYEFNPILGKDSYTLKKAPKNFKAMLIQSNIKSQ